jgi:hypothetical protein
MPWSVSDYNTNPALNPLINGIDIAEGSAAAGYNNALRQMMADIKTWTVTYGIVTPVSIAQGGTGQSTAAAGLAALGGLPVAYRDLPIASKAGAFTFADSERGGGIFFFGASAADATINPQSSTPITTGAVYALRAGGSGALTVRRGAGVYLSVNGAGPSADAVMSPGAVATLINWGGDIWTIVGVGVS